MPRLVIKVGTNLLTKPDGSLALDFISSLVSQLADLHKNNDEVILVTSGAMASGRSELHLKKAKKTIPWRQVLAAVGQAILINTYRQFFTKYQITIAQILLTDFDFKNKPNFLNTKNILNLLLQEKVLPIVNENDVTAYAEIKFGDNDILSAKVSAMIAADLLIILTDVDGLFDKNPLKNPKAKLMAKVIKIDKQIEEYAGDSLSKNSRGGMISKIKAASYAVESGIPVIIANGQKSQILTKIMKKMGQGLDETPIGTYFSASKSQKENSTKRWLQPKILTNCQVIIDIGAVKAVKQSGGSLLPSGIIKTVGQFKRGDIVNIIDEHQEKIGFGQVNYSSQELSQIKGLNSKKIEKILGYALEEEVIHRDNLVVF